MDPLGNSQVDLQTTAVHTFWPQKDTILTQAVTYMYKDLKNVIENYFVLKHMDISIEEIRGKPVQL